ncbi:unnamed protein product [Heterosigma akashiwo]
MEGQRIFGAQAALLWRWQLPGTLGVPAWHFYFCIQRDTAGGLYLIATTQGPPPLPNFLSPRARALVERCLRVEPSERPKAADLLQDPFFFVTSTNKNAPQQVVADQIRKKNYGSSSSYAAIEVANDAKTMEETNKQ